MKKSRLSQIGGLGISGFKLWLLDELLDEAELQTRGCERRGDG